MLTWSLPNLESENETTTSEWDQKIPFLQATSIQNEKALVPSTPALSLKQWDSGQMLVLGAPPELNEDIGRPIPLRSEICPTET